ncbi:MAG: penicillin acylase family protein, partial [Pseudomonas sp.]|nr:penicillin acylase family protein [Pseudomonas sp.]
MKRSLKVLVVVIAAVSAGGGWYLHSKQPLRSGEVSLANLQAPVSVRYDERGVPHIQAQNETDMYRALGYVHAQDRLFQMEMMRRLSRGELAAVLGPKLIDTDRLFRTLGIRQHADA